MRLIDVDVIKLPKGFFEKVNNVPKFYEWLSEQPTIDPVKHGRWIKHKDRSCWYCSKCNADDYYAYLLNSDTISDAVEYKLQDNFCPNCGAKMSTSNNAHWIKQPNGEYKCSVCGDTTLVPLYECHTCGARMEGEKRE